MKKTSKTVRAAILLLVLCMISTAMLGGTFAKYTSEYAGQDTALIAKWNVTVEEGGTAFAISPSDAVPLDLFDHAYNTNILSTAGSDKIIAPGVKGDFTLNIANTGDVAAKMTFDFEASGSASTAPIEYSLDESNWGDLTTLETNLEGLAQMESVAETDGTALQTVYWRWPYEQYDSTDPELAAADEDDTDLGIASNTAFEADGNRTTYILKITATATQIEPDTL
jgi:hypothetical protein